MKLLIVWKPHTVDTAAGLTAIGEPIGTPVEIQRVYAWSIAPNLHGTLPDQNVQVEDSDIVDGTWADFVDHYFNYWINGSGQLALIPAAARPADSEIESRNLSTLRVDPEDSESDLITDQNDAGVPMSIVRAQSVSLFDTL